MLAYNYLAESAGAITAESTAAAAESTTAESTGAAVFTALSIEAESLVLLVEALLQAATKRPRARARKPTFFILIVFKVFEMRFILYTGQGKKVTRRFKKKILVTLGY
ncbi:hypothetical protein [Chitinophaga alhagiae]|uniref:hypothetical protein n=1 Tax=Chitinophaga alhagiae TaxID=2203219 RepID=UPI00130075F3|nr:hypothetical protein [Chitinophaga alhagiae]